jgi:hypothetical protein
MLIGRSAEKRVMVKVKLVHLLNYCGYTDTTFDFCDEQEKPRPFALFYGPNGIGKSTLLRAIQLASNPAQFRGRERESQLLMRKSIYDEEYLPTVDNVQTDKVKNPMRIEVLYETDDGEKAVILDNDGLLLNELPPTMFKGGFSYFGDADSPMATQKFLLAAEQADKFLSFCYAVYGYPCELASPVTSQGVDFFTDFIIKKGSVKVHFKSMSAGEKKIATVVSDLCQPINTAGRDIVLVDNVEMHVYWKRHARMIDKLRETFPEKQIVATTHSSLVINHVPPEFHFDLEFYRPDYKLLDVVDEIRPEVAAAALAMEQKKVLRGRNILEQVALAKKMKADNAPKSAS